ncbi:MAG TPA: sulfatase-like hydrolase/transferase [Bacteroidales bacterium]|nr:sulfatase-like hydrolase/transferase [Bacteroidales bacterium]
MNYKLLSLCTGAAISASSLNITAKGTERPNILFIMTDQHNAGYFGFMGHPILKTPNLDELAQHSAVFTSAYCASPVSGPSRAAVFTGKYPLQNGVTSNWIKLKDESGLLTKKLAEAGYFNGMIGKLHLTPVTDDHGFQFRRICDSPYDLYDKEEIVENDYLKWAASDLGISPERLAALAGESERCGVKDSRFWLGWSWADDKHQITTWTGNEAVSFISSYDRGQPFFLHVSFFGPHHPYSTCAPWDSMYDPQKVVLPPTFGKIQPGAQAGIRPEWTEETWRKIIAAYYGNISAIDNQVGRIIKTLKDKGLWENTLIIFTSDHGDHMGDFSQLGKGTMLESSVRVPLLIKAPGKEAGEKRYSEIINLIDLYNTFLHYAGITANQNSSESTSIQSLLEGSKKWKNQTFSSIGSADGKNGQVMYIKDNLKCIGFLKNGVMKTELYNRNDKIPDSQNIADIPGNARIRAEMETTIRKWIERQ